MNFKILLLLCSWLNVFAGQKQAEEKQAAALQESFIWLQATKAGEQQYVAFRKTFNLKENIAAAQLRVFADNRFIIWINGQYVERGPARFDPKGPQYDILDIKPFLHKGKNAIAVLVHYYAVDSFTEWNEQNARMMEHTPGLTAALNIDFTNGTIFSLRTDETWAANKNTQYKASPGSYSSVPDNIDARLSDGDWSVAGYNDEKWEHARKISGSSWGKLSPRLIPLLKEQTLVPDRVVQQTTGANVHDSVQSLRALLPLEMEAGSELVIDIGKVRQAYHLLELDAEEGASLQVGHATLFYDHKKQPLIVSFIPHPEDRYIAKKGFQRYMGGDTHGFKYLVIKVLSGKIRLKSVAITERSYPYERMGSFTSNDTLLNTLWKVCVNTVEACSEDAYVDCADRERAQWIADGYKMSFPVARVALAAKEQNGTYTFGDARLLRKMIQDMGYSQVPDGRLQPMRPSVYPLINTHGVIDDYSCLWVQAAVEYYERTGDIAFVKQIWGQLQRAMDYFLNRKIANGLINAREFIYFDNPLKYVQCEGATINAFIYGSLQAIARMAKVLGDAKAFNRYAAEAVALYKSYNSNLWNERAGTYNAASFSDEGKAMTDNPKSFSLPYEGPLEPGKTVAPNYHAALMALYFNLVPADRHARVLHFLLNSFNKTTEQQMELWWPYTSRYLLDVLYREQRTDLSQTALNFIRNAFWHMTRYETATTSEGWWGGASVHESSAFPAYFMSAFVLGVRTVIENGKLSFIIKPNLGDLQHAEGTVLTEFGKTDVQWTFRDGGGSLHFSINTPKGATPVLYIPVMSERATLVLNGEMLVKAGKIKGELKRSGGYYVIPLKENRCRGIILKGQK
ncbi:hypothetical protein A8C56_09590 [Niabella ginsenosidivorans]|uniref:Alpha-L-rhamnosidase six-hairpin glycosidase domain-containing protein n=1 Tax=Niabella ginsenosidivorans TaxID=1176587 RepID=A0A1A9I3E3_9BACT|nr:alpha-L-rhamnosidase N-terminal domain-containing protein [Niabella ginsenosidivorans]ANH81201.1 hypothetical protein A8C56_09590 [Niabella ginsenosidivorans]